MIDFDALAREEGTNWVYSGADCMTGDINRCLISMSPDGGDAVVVREFDLTSRRFVEDGFKSPVSKSDITWHDPGHADADAGLSRRRATGLAIRAP